MDKSQIWYVKQKKPNTREYTLCDSIYMKSRTYKGNLWLQKWKCNNLGTEREMNWKRAWGNVPGNRYVLYLVLYAGYMVIKSCQKSSNLTLKICTVQCMLIIVQLN